MGHEPGSGGARTGGSAPGSGRLAAPAAPSADGLRRPAVAAAQVAVFVYGTLKQGFRNAHLNRGRRVAGEFVTVRPHPLHLVGPARLPWLLDRPGQGHRVRGELYEVDVQALAQLDALERLGEPGWYTRAAIEVVPLDEPGAACRQAQVYFGCASELVEGCPGPLAAYLPEHDGRGEG